MENDAYKDAGVDIDAAMETKRSIKNMVRSTFNSSVLTDIGSFGGLFKPDFAGIDSPVLVSSADGVGTKLKVACMTGRHNTVGADLVNHCCNDILVMGARPLFFLDYLAYSRHDDAVVCAVISGLTQACRENNCALIGGEMAELPDVYHPGEYDLAGVIIGVVGEHDILDGSRVKKNDVILGLASTGLHTNGYTLARKLVFRTAGLKPDDILPGTNETTADALLAVHKSYGPSILPLLQKDGIHAMAHITGGGFTGNIDRSLPDTLDAEIYIGSWDIPGIFRFLETTGSLSEKELYRTFNMGIGIALIVDPEKIDDTTKALVASGEQVYTIGRVTEGKREVHLVHGY
ncbi:MAG: phosphoribosylformylglycinamidine cyclo-ligase [Candidatus Latescibacteria bacterium]|nr:phosphoribosylformylglycinamidine cyclo-ligase [Candidatus Latescibacterota bacterium]